MEESYKQYYAMVDSMLVTGDPNDEVINGGVMDGDAYFDSFPAGYRFRPSDEELIQNYLMNKIFNMPLPVNRIPEVNLYNYHPQELTGMYKLIREDEWYFFTSRNRKYPNGSRPNRAAGNGFWKPTGTDKPIPTENPIGVKKSLDFYEGRHPGEKKTNWKMHEYKIHEKYINPSNKRGRNDTKLDDWVLCKVYKKAEKKKDENNEE